MAHYVIEGDGTHPIAVIAKCHRDHLENNFWWSGDRLDIEVPEPIIYELKEDNYDESPNIDVYDDTMPIPYMHNDLYEAMCTAGVDNLQVYDAVIRDLKRGVNHTNYKAFNVVGMVAAVDMKNSTRMGTTDSTMVDADFDRLVLDESKCKGLLMFRLAENHSAVVVDEIVKNEVEKRGIEGLFFYPSGEWSG